MDLPQQEENVPLADFHRTSYSTLNGVPLHSLGIKEDHNQPHYHPNYNRQDAVAARYRECLKNHAASFGGNATDGCGEFMPGGADGTLEALRCSACGCHRNFHRKEVEGEPPSSSIDHYLHFHGFIMPRPVAVAPPLLPLPEQQVGRVSVAMPELGKKRLRTKFTVEQKARMLGFAEKVGWRMQGQEEGVVHQFCEEIGVKRRVLKVWMHNNKHNFANKTNSITKFE